MNRPGEVGGNRQAEAPLLGENHSPRLGRGHKDSLQGFAVSVDIVFQDPRGVDLPGGPVVDEGEEIVPGGRGILNGLNPKEDSVGAEASGTGDRAVGKGVDPGEVALRKVVEGAIFGEFNPSVKGEGFDSHPSRAPLRLAVVSQEAGSRHAEQGIFGEGVRVVAGLLFRIQSLVGGQGAP